jgi:voltage-gated potassium channel
LEDSVAIEGKDKLSLLDIVILVLSIYVLASLMVETFSKLPSNMTHLLAIIDNFICCIFLADFGYRFYKAPDKLKFIKWGWIDLVSSIPTIGVLRCGRFIRLVRLLRILRAFRSIKFITTYIYRNKKQGTFTSVTLIAFLMIVFGSISILQVETAANSNIKTAEDAIWWSFTTITTVGYGDLYPVTTEGRIIAAFLMVTGVGIFGTFTGFVASWFVKDKREG